MSSDSHSSLSRWKNRSRTEIVVAIITLAQNGTSKTQLMEKAHLNSQQLNRYLTELTGGSLVETSKANRRKVYTATQKGIQYLKQCGTLRKFRMEGSEHIS